MAMTINAVTVANPTTLDADSVAIAATNITYAGLKSYYHSQSTTVHQTLHVLSVGWEQLTPTELSTIRTQWQAAAVAYVDATFDGIELPSSFTVTDKVSMIAYPGSSLSVEYTQGYDIAGTGPILFDATATFVTSPMVIP